MSGVGAAIVAACVRVWSRWFTRDRALRLAAIETSEWHEAAQTFAARELNRQRTLLEVETRISRELLERLNRSASLHVRPPPKEIEPPHAEDPAA